MFKATLGIIFGVFLLGCTATVGTQIGTIRKDRIEPPFLIAQVCVQPDLFRKTIGFDTVRNDSVLGRDQAVTGTTEDGHPVFETYIASFSDLKALLVTLERPARFVFNPPDDATYDRWSSWRSPNAVARDGNWSVGVGMVNGIRPNQIAVVDANAPMIRYRLMSFSDYLLGVRRRHSAGQDLGIPPC